MAAKIFFTAALIAVHSFTPALAVADPLITPAPVAKRDHYDIAKRQATTSPLPLTEYHYPFSAIPYQVNPYAVGRGPQAGYNLCNSTTEGPTSECQTLEVNSLVLYSLLRNLMTVEEDWLDCKADFCLWGSPTANGLIGNIEAAVIAYCSQPGHGGRVMPAGTITGAQVKFDLHDGNGRLTFTLFGHQFMKTSAYIQITGHINQSGIGLDPTDTGGELDPHGADLVRLFRVVIAL